MRNKYPGACGGEKQTRDLVAAAEDMTDTDRMLPSECRERIRQLEAMLQRILRETMDEPHEIMADTWSDADSLLDGR